MITKEYLEEYEINKKNYLYEIRKLVKDIKKGYKQATVDSVFGSSKNFPYISGHIKIEGIDESKIKRLEKRKKNFEKKLEKLNKELQYNLNNLEDRQMADIVEKKYIDELDWKNISMDIGYADESGARKYFDRYF